jgi:hypothetical protein
MIAALALAVYRLTGQKVGVDTLGWIVSCCGLVLLMLLVEIG